MLMILALAVTGCPKKEPPRNVLLVIIDTLPASHVGAYGYERDITPHLDEFAKQAIVFDNAIAPSSWTLPSIASILTGVWPHQHQAGLHLDPYTQEDRRMAKMKPDVVSMAEVFKHQGYATAGFFNNPFVHPGFGLDVGFDLYSYAPGDNLKIRTAEQVTQTAAHWLEAREDDERGFFMVLHFFDPHLAYDPSPTFSFPYIQGYKGELKAPFDADIHKIRSGEMKLSQEDKNFIMGLYDAEVAGVDAELWKFMNFLKEKGLYENTAIVVTADHGEEFWEHGSFEHGHSLYNELLHVPLIMRLPGSYTAGSKVPQRVTLCDIFPTLAAYMEISLPFKVSGINLMPRGGVFTIPPRYIISENVHYGPQQQAFFSANYKMIINIESGRIQVFDLKADPQEINNVFGAVEMPQKIKEQIQFAADQINEGLKEPANEALLDQETWDKLKALGYVGSKAK